MKTSDRKTIIESGYISDKSLIEMLEDHKTGEGSYSYFDVLVIDSSRLKNKKIRKLMEQETVLDISPDAIIIIINSFIRIRDTIILFRYKVSDGVR